MIRTLTKRADHVSAFFEAIGFKRTERAMAPQAILGTRQARELCPSSAVVLSRSIRL